MIKKKKVVRFRELFDVIDEWLKSYNFDNTAELLRSEHDLDLTTGTLKSYVHRHRKHLAKQAVVGDELVQHSKNTDKPNEVDISSENTEADINQKEVEENNVSSAPSKKVKKKKATPEELKAALAKMKSEMTEEEYNWKDLL